jgi:hypothetical protein
MGLTRPNLAQVKTINANFTDALGVLNRTATGTNTKDLGWVFNRGSDTNQVFLWDESADEFVLASTSETGTTEGDVTLSAYADLQIGRLISKGLIYPTTDGTNGQAIITDGAGNLSFTTVDNGPTDTDGLTEGSTNLYYTDARVDTNVSSALTHFHSSVQTVTSRQATNNSSARVDYTFSELSNAVHYQAYLNRQLLRPAEYSVSGTTVTIAIGVLATDDELEVTGLQYN